MGEVINIDKKAFKSNKKLDETKIEKIKKGKKNKLKAVEDFYFIAFKDGVVSLHGETKKDFSIELAEDTEEYANLKDYQDRLKELEVIS